MERHSVLILSNLDTAEHLEIGIWLISDMETEGTLLRWKNEEGSRMSYTAMCASWEGESLMKERN